MEKFCHIKLFDLQLEGKKILQDFSLFFDEKKSVCLLGESGSGKSLLLKSLLKNPNLFEVQGKIAFYFLESEKSSNWKNDINYENLSLEWKQFLDSFLADKINFEKRYALVLKLLQKPDYLFSEDLHSILSFKEMRIFLNFLGSQNISFFCVTNQIENTPFFDYLLVIKNNRIALEGRTISVLKEEKIMKLLGYSLPFYVNMSIQLGYYGIIDSIYLSKEELEEAIWPSK